MFLYFLKVHLVAYNVIIIGAVFVFVFVHDLVLGFDITFSEIFFVIVFFAVSVFDVVVVILEFFAMKCGVVWFGLVCNSVV